MNRRRLILAGGTVAWAAIGAVRRNRRPSRAHLSAGRLHATVAPLVLVPIVLPFGYSIDYGALWGGFWSFLGGVTGAVKDFVLEAIDKALDIVTGLINTVDDVYHAITGVLTEGLSYAYRAATDTANAIKAVTVETYNMLDGAFSNLRQQLASMLEHAWDDLKDWVIDNFPDWIGGIFGDLWDVLTALAGIGLDGVRFLINLIDDPIGFLWNLLSDVVGDAIQAALDAANLAGDVITKIWHILEWLATHADDLTEEVLSRLWGGLKWIIEHLDDFTIDAFNDLISMSPDRFAERMLEAMDAQRGPIEAKFAGWLN